MSKSEFLQTLSEKLSAELPHSVVLSNLQYYENYIDGEVAKGRSLEAVMDELGDPYMIARTIIDAQMGEQDYADETVYVEPENQGDSQRTTESTAKSFSMGKHGCLITALVIILAVIVVLAVVGSVISFLWPVLAPVLLILLVISIFKDKRR